MIGFIWMASAATLFAEGTDPATSPTTAVSNQTIIQFSPAATTEERAAYIASIGGTVIEEIPALNAVVVSISPNAPQYDPSPSSLPPIVTISEPDYFVTALEEPMQSQQWALPVIGAPSAWESLPADSASVVVAVIDSGICADHPDLANRILAGYDFVEDDVVPQDTFGHGCAVAGVIAADGNNGIGIAGVAPNARIMPLRVLDGRGNGLYSDVAAAVVWAADHGAQIINLSLGGANQSLLLQNAIDYAIARNSIVIAAAGNTGGAVLYPAAYAPVIAVGSVDQNLERSSFSSYGPEIDVYAPGSDVLSTALDGGYTTRSGTSIAAPQVAGIAALEMAYGRDLTLNGGVIAFDGGSTPVPTTPTTGELPLMPMGARPPNIPDGYMIVYGDIQVPIDFFEVGGQFSHQGNLWPRSGPTEASPSLIPYAFDLTLDGGGQPNVSPLNQQRAIEAMAAWEAVANVDFIPRTDQDDFIFYRDTTNDVDGMGNSVAANNSPVGRVGGQQTLNMTSWGAKFVIVHELGHAIGLVHEHQRPGRDTFVTIVMGNVQAGQAGNFNLTADDESTNIGNYDFNSVMHYGQYAFSVCNAGAAPPPCTDGTGGTPDLRTVIVKPGFEAFQTTMGNLGGMTWLTDIDMNGINDIYAGIPTAPTNDVFSRADETGFTLGFPFILGLGAPQTANAMHYNASVSESDPTMSCAPGGNRNYAHTVWYHYRTPYSPSFNHTIQLTTVASTVDPNEPLPFDPVMAVYTGTEGALTQIACDDDSGPALGAQLSFNAVGGTDYYVMVAKAGFGALPSLPLIAGLTDTVINVVLDVVPVANDAIENAITIPNTIFPYTQQLDAYKTTVVPSDPNLSCTFTPRDFAHTIWYRYTAPLNQNVRFSADYDGQVLTFSGQLPVVAVFTGNPGSLTEVGCNDYGVSTTFGEPVYVDFAANEGTTYYIMVAQGDTDEIDSTRRLDVSLDIIAPSNDNFAQARVIPTTAMPQDFDQDIFRATVEGTDPAMPCGGARNNTVWYRYTPTANQRIRLDTSTSGYDSIIGVYTGSPGSFTEVACDDNGASGGIATIDMTANTAYHIMIAKFGTAVSFPRRLHLQVIKLPPANDNFDDAAEISALPGVFNAVQDVDLSTSPDSDPAITCLTPNDNYVNSIWYKYTPTVSRYVQLSTEGSAFDTAIGVYTGTANALTQIACDNNDGTLTSSVVGWNTTANTTYYIMLAKVGTTPVVGTASARFSINALVQNGPLNAITTKYGNPSYEWTDIPGARYYYLFLQATTGVQRINEVISDTLFCDGTICSVDPTQLPSILAENYRLPNGSYQWSVRGWNYDGPAEWVGFGNFTLTATPPGLVTIGAATNLNQLRPTLNWTLDVNANSATAFNIYVAPAANLGTGSMFLTNLTRLAACGSINGLNCSVQLNVDLLNATDYSFFVQSVNLAGALTNTGPYDNGYAGSGNFRTNFTIPNIPANLAVNYNQGLPSISWDDSPNAQSFNVYISPAANWGTQTHFQTYPRTTGVNGLCNGITCTLRNLHIVLANGAYNFAVNAVGSASPSVDGTYNNGYGVLENAALNLTAPLPPSAGLSPALGSNVTTGHQTFSWNTVAGAISYQLAVASNNTGQFIMRHEQWYWADAPDCTPHPGTCTISPDVYLTAGENIWNVRAYGPGGLSAYANAVTGITFNVTSNIPALVVLGAPAGMLPINNPTFSWTDQAGADWYQVAIGVEAPVFTLNHLEWYRAERGAGKLCNLGTCTLTIPGLALPNNVYVWNVQASSPQGIGPWNGAPYTTFTIAVPAPAAPTLLTPAADGIVYNTNRPVFTWQVTPNATSYTFELRNSDNNVVFITTQPESVVCNTITGICTGQLPNPVVYGVYSWKMQAIGQGGAGVFTPVRNFISLSINRTPMADPVLVQSDDSAITRSGAWASVASESALDSNYLASSATIGDTLTLNFTGTQADIIYVAGPNYGSWAVEVDGVIMLTINANTLELTFGQVATVGGLSAGQHTLRIIAAGGASIGIDAVIIDGQPLIGVAPIAIAPPTIEPVLPTPLPTLIPVPSATPEPAVVEPTPEATSAPETTETP